MPDKRHHPGNIRFEQIETDVHALTLERDVHITLLAPAGCREPLPLLVFQDGQDFPQLGLANTLRELTATKQIPPVLIAGVHAGENRIYEYGIAQQPDYMGRGNKAGLYTGFLLEELLPFLSARFPVGAAHPGNVIAGFSLGGLMALDIAWNHPTVFPKAGIFSGSLWWRKKAFGDAYVDSDRIMHEQIGLSPHKPALQFWFQTGTHDETSDRDNDGVIDSIDDTLDCIAALERKGYRWGEDIVYHEVAGGEHNPATWRKVMPRFLRWATRLHN